MKLPMDSVIKRLLAGALTATAIASASVVGVAYADPVDDISNPGAADGIAELNELSRRAEQLTEQMHSAQLDLDEKLAAAAEAEKKHADDIAAVEASRMQLETYQGIINDHAAAAYMGGATGGLNAILTSESPQRMIDKIAVQRVMAEQSAAQINRYRALGDEALRREADSARSADDAKVAAEQAAAVRADLQRKQSQLQVQIAAVKSRYQGLTEQERTTLAEPGPFPQPPAAPAPTDNPVTVLAALPAPAPGVVGGARAVEAALTRIGSPYSWGGSGPHAFDCSGLVMWAFGQAGVSLPHSSQALARGGQPVSMDQIQPGDIVNYYSDASHSGIYIGDGMMVHASTFGTPVRVAPVGSAPIYNVRRY